MSELKHARELLALAAKDLQALTGMGDLETFADEIFGFHAQQAVEKTLKAWIAASGERYPLIPSCGHKGKNKQNCSGAIYCAQEGVINHATTLKIPV
jgi:hypothetical protein